MPTVRPLVLSLALLFSCGASVRLKPGSFSDLADGRLLGVDLAGDFDHDRLVKACTKADPKIAERIRWEQTYGRYCELDGIRDGDLARVLLATDGVLGGVHGWYAEPKWGTGEADDAARLARLGLEAGAPVWVYSKLGVLHATKDPERFVVRALEGGESGPVVGVAALENPGNRAFGEIPIDVGAVRAEADRAAERGDAAAAWSTLRFLRNVRHPDVDALAARLVARFRDGPLARFTAARAAFEAAPPAARWGILDGLLAEAREVARAPGETPPLDLAGPLDAMAALLPKGASGRAFLTEANLGAAALAGMSDVAWERARDKLAVLADEHARASAAPRVAAVGLGAEIAAHGERIGAYRQSFGAAAEERWAEVNASREALDARLAAEIDRAAAEGRHATAAALRLARLRAAGRTGSTGPLHGPVDAADPGSQVRADLAAVAAQLLPSLGATTPELTAALGRVRLGRTWGASQHAGVQPLAAPDLKGPAGAVAIGATRVDGARRTEEMLGVTYTRYRQRETAESWNARNEAVSRPARIEELNRTIAYMKANRGSGGYEVEKEAVFGYGGSSRQLAPAGYKGQHGSDYVDVPSSDSTVYQPAVYKRTYSEEQIRQAESELHAMKTAGEPGVQYVTDEVPVQVLEHHEVWTGTATRDVTLTVGGKTLTYRQSMNLADHRFVRSDGDAGWSVPARDEHLRTPENLERWVTDQLDAALPDALSAVVAQAIAARVETVDARWKPDDAALEVALRRAFFGEPPTTGPAAPFLASMVWPALQPPRKVAGGREDEETGDLVLSTEIDARDVAFDPTGRTVAVGTRHGVMTLDARTGAGQLSVGLGGMVEDVRYSADGSTIFAHTKDRLVVLDAARGHLLRELPLETFVAPSISRAGDRVLVYSGERIWVWTPATGEQIGPDLRKTKTADAVSLSADGSRACIADWNDVLVVDTATAKVLYTARHENWLARDCEISPDGGVVVGRFSSHDDYRMVAFDVDGGQRLVEGAVKDLDSPLPAFRPDGLVYVTSDGGREVHQTLTPLGKRLGVEAQKPFRAKEEGGLWRYSPDGRLLLQGTRYGTSVYVAATGEHVIDFEGTGAAISDDGARLVGSVYVRKPVGELTLRRVPRGQRLAKGLGAITTVAEAGTGTVRLESGTRDGVAAGMFAYVGGRPLGRVVSATSDAAVVEPWDTAPAVAPGATVLVTSKD